MRLDEACEPIFARHETFHPRLGWFRKAVLAAAMDQGDFFLSDDAPVRLGVGKNMVRSIKFWGTAARLVCDIDHPANSRVSRTVPTNLAVGLLGPDGLDPYMEQPATWWWIHWMLMAPPSAVPVWWILFNELHAVEFDLDLAERVCADSVAGSSWNPPHPSSIEKDVTAFVRTYTDGPSSRGKFDDQFGCPLRDLRLITNSPAGFRFSSGTPRNLPADIVLAAVLDYLSITGSTARSTTLSRLVTDAGSPALAFRLNEAHLADLLAPAVAATKGVSLSAPAGAAQLGWRGDPADLAHGILCNHFGAAPDRASVAGPMAREANLDVVVRLLLNQHAEGVVL